MARIGGGIEDMERLAASFTRHAGAVDALRQELGNDVNGTDWEGGAADRFREAWTSDFEPTLRRLQAALQDCNAEVGRRRQALLDAGG